MTISDICKNINCDYETLVQIVIDILEVIGYGIYTIDIIDAMDRLHDNQETITEGKQAK